MDFRFVAYDPQTGAKLYQLPRANSVNIGDTFGTRGTLELTYSAKAVNARDLPTFLEVQAEVTFDVGQNWAPIGPSMLRLSGSHEDTDQAGMRTLQFVGREWLLTKARVGNGDLELIDGKRPFYQASPGQILRTLILEAQDRGAADGIVIGNFDTAKDSAGISWSKVATIYYSPGLPISSVLENLVEQGMCDYRMDGRTLNLYDPETRMARDLTDRTNPVRVHGAVTEAPVKYTLEDLANSALLMGDDGFELEVDNPTAPDNYGRLEVTIEQGGVSDNGTARVMVDEALHRGSREIREITRSQSAAGAAFLPYRDYRVGDYVQVHTGGAWERYRVRELQLARDGQEWTIHTVINDRLQELLLKLAKRTSGIVNGTTGSGGDGTRPTQPEKPGIEPAAPEGLVIDQQVYLDRQGIARGQITAGWGAVTDSTKGQAVEIGGYELWWRRNETQAVWARVAVTDGPITVSHSPVVLTDTFGIAMEYQWRVRAIAEASARPGPFSDIVTLTMMQDTVPPNVPSLPNVETELRIVTVTVDGLDEFGEAMPVDFNHNRIYFAFAEDMAGAEQAGTLTQPGSWNSGSMAPDVPVWVAVSAVDHVGNESAMTPAQAVTPRKLVDDESIRGELSTIDDKIDDAVADLNQTIDDIVIDADGTKNFYRDTIPTDTESSEGDLWFDSSDKNTPYIYQDGAWITVASSFASPGAGESLSTIGDGVSLSKAVTSDAEFAKDATRNARWTYGGAVATGDMTFAIPAVGGVDASTFDMTFDGTEATKVGLSLVADTTLYIHSPGGTPVVESILLVGGGAISTPLAVAYAATVEAGTGGFTGATHHVADLGTTARGILGQYLALGVAEQIAFGIRVTLPYASGAWVEISDLTVTQAVTANGIGDKAITTDKIAVGAITAESGIIGSINAGTIIFGEMDGARIKARSIYGDKLLIGGDRNMVPNGDLSLGSAEGWPESPTYRTSNGPPSNTPGVPNVFYSAGVGTVSWSGWGSYPIQSGDTLVFECWVKNDKANSVMFVEIRDQDGAHLSTASGTTWQAVEGGAGGASYPISRWTVPTTWTKVISTLKVGGTGTREAKFASVYFNHSAGATRDATPYLAGVKLYKRVGATLIEDGAITTGKILAQAITAGKIAALAIEADHISANAITADKIRGGAIDGKLITGARIRTAASGARVELTTEGLKAYRSDNAVVFTTDTSDGSVEMFGNLMQTRGGTTIEVGYDYLGGPGIQWSDSHIYAFPPGIRYGERAGSAGTMETLVQGPGVSGGNSFLNLTEEGKGFNLEAWQASGDNRWGVIADVPGNLMRVGSLLNDAPYMYFNRGSGTTGQAWIGYKHPTNGGYASMSLQDRDIFLGAFDSTGAVVSRLWGNTSDTTLTAGSRTLFLRGHGVSIVSSEKVYMPGIRSSSSAVSIGRDGDVVLMSSARKYKLIEEPIESTVESFEDKLLSVEAKTWVDRSRAEMIADHQTAIANGETPDDLTEGMGGLERIPGVVAEDMIEAGLDLFVQFDDGEPEAVMYDRIGPALIPIIRRLRDRVDALETKLGETA
ncbi:hypothetical protein [Brevibacterium aurantiacum]|uniref:Peptidase S74 domain-containing protein n=1 Tax=Brevibacterium aurantiacum TaxID=273384 RepID=A0A556C3N9_BREAU|nr:hypothetical protein [Brevibacterium aurantiacum]TSI11976.1 hypothetical protein FO013_21270 [Brevibacterium aurantiacum]